MKIQIDGGGPVNKGAQLMYFAVLECLRQSATDYRVVHNANGVWNEKIDVPVMVEYPALFYRYGKLVNKYKLATALSLLHAPFATYDYLTTFHLGASGVEAVLDINGYAYCDFFYSATRRVRNCEQYFKSLKKRGVKHILLPQAFGPFETPNGRRIAAILAENVDLMIAREKTSYDHLINAGVPKEKTALYPDFTSLVVPLVPEKFRAVAERAVGLIPNCQMFQKGNCTHEQFVGFFVELAKYLRKKDERFFLLNHEGSNDKRLCCEIAEKLGGDVMIVDGLNARETKGVISISSALISARYHGVVNALNTHTPCLATSWSYKYQKLFEDYRQEDCVLDLTDPLEKTQRRVDQFLESRTQIRESLEEPARLNLETAREMWRSIERTL